MRSKWWVAAYSKLGQSNIQVYTEFLLFFKNFIDFYDKCDVSTSWRQLAS